MRKIKGFTLIELMIVIAIIAIIAAIAIPNLMQSRIRANETATISQLRNYVQAQSLFHGRGFGKLGANTSAFSASLSAYADNYTNLYYGATVVGNAGVPTGTSTAIRLISKAHADAVTPAVPVGGAVATVKTTEKVGVLQAFNGYWYGEPKEVTKASEFFAERYSLTAAPTDSSRTGSKMFFIDDSGNVLNYLLGAGVSNDTAIKGTSTPLTIGTEGWEIN